MGKSAQRAARLLHPQRGLVIEWWPIARPRPFPGNARKIPPAAIAKVALSLRTYGWQQPIVVDKHDVIIVGHTRLLAAQQEAMAEVPVTVALGLTPAQVRAYRLMDNRSNQESSWDFALLGPELAGLRQLGLDIALTGFDPAELLRLAPIEGQTDPEAAPALEEAAVSRLGDLWHLGAHQVLCGDATDKQTVGRLLAGITPAIMVTDPPYGVAYDPSWRNKAGITDKKRSAIAGDTILDWSDAWKLFPGPVAYIWHAGKFAAECQLGLEAAGFALRSQIVWIKNRFAISRGDYHWQHEPALYAVKTGHPSGWVGGAETEYEENHDVASYGVAVHRTGGWEGGRRQSTVWNIDAAKFTSAHPTQKPIECMKRPIENNTQPGQAVYDPFLGTGTSVIASEMCGRVCRGLELDPRFVDVIVRRWQEWSGGIATLEDGKSVARPTFEEIIRLRAKPATSPSGRGKKSKAASRGPR